MNQCPFCKLECTITPADWSGGRLKIECTSCGFIEMSENSYQRIIATPEDHWQMKILRDSIRKIHGTVVISKNDFDVLEAKPLKSKFTKMDKWSLRKKAERTKQVKTNIFFTGKNG